MTDDSGDKSLVARVLNKTITALENASSAVLLVMMLLTFADVIGRYLLAAPIFGASEMVSGMLALVIFAGLGVTNARDDHIVVELIDQPIRSLSPRFYDTVIQLFSVLTMGLISYVLAESAYEAYHLKSLTFVLEMPVYYITAIVAVLSAVSCLSLLAGIYLRWQKGKMPAGEASL